MNKMVVVTGATTGTGYCVAQKFAANGYDVCITSRDQARAQEAAARLKAENDGKIETFGYGLEVLDEPQMAAMFDDLKQKGHLVSTLVLVAANMGINMPNFLEVDFKDWIRVIDTNIGWNFMFCRQAAKHMLQLGGGAIVVIGSVNGIRTTKNRSAYCTSKSGLHGLARNLAVELGPATSVSIRWWPAASRRRGTMHARRSRTRRTTKTRWGILRSSRTLQTQPTSWPTTSRPASLPAQSWQWTAAALHSSSTKRKASSFRTVP